MQYVIYLFFIFPFFNFEKTQEHTNARPVDSMYFPSNTNWERTSISSLGWNESAVKDLKNYLQQKNTKSFIILVNGRIVMEEYFDGHSVSAIWEWNSAGKTLVSTAVGIAQQEGLLHIEDKVSKYLGNGWSNEPLEYENLITIKNLLSMTSGLNDSKQLVRRANLTYLADAGKRWSYSNVFQLLMKVVATASNQSFDEFYNNRIKNKIGMDGYWKNGIIFKIYHSNTRSMARFGLLLLNKGKWENDQLVNENYIDELSSSSQSINPAYGYLCWLNDKKKYMVPRSQKLYTGSLVPNAPADMFAAMGARDQRVYIIPSKNMVVVRMGETANPSKARFAVSGFDNELWEKINAVIQ